MTLEQNVITKLLLTKMACANPACIICEYNVVAYSETSEPLVSCLGHDRASGTDARQGPAFGVDRLAVLFGRACACARALHINELRQLKAPL